MRGLGFGFMGFWLLRLGVSLMYLGFFGNGDHELCRSVPLLQRPDWFLSWDRVEKVLAERVSSKVPSLGQASNICRIDEDGLLRAVWARTM